MIIGIPKEIKPDEYRVAILPAGVEDLVRAGHHVLVESGAGLGSGISDAQFAEAGAQIVPSGREVYEAAQMVVKVKEPQPTELCWIRPGQIIFGFFHFAADRNLTEQFLATGAVAVAYETLQDARGRLPLLAPMSEVAGRMSIQQGAKYLERPQGGRGVLLGGVPGVGPAKVLILGGGVVGLNAAKMAAGLGASVCVLDIDLDRLRYLADILPPNCCVLYSDRYTIREQLSQADLVIGAVLVPGARAPCLIEEDDLLRMPPGAVIVDVAIDQGGCCATSRPTTHAQPVFVVHDVVHYCVTNIPGAVPRTSTPALCHATLPWVRRLADLGVEKAAQQFPELARAVNIYRGIVTHPALASALGLPCENRFGSWA
jgi:alanine dehydrogenase